jgi:hypothetical protein
VSGEVRILRGRVFSDIVDGLHAVVTQLCVSLSASVGGVAVLHRSSATTRSVIPRVVAWLHPTIVERGYILTTQVALSLDKRGSLIVR